MRSKAILMVAGLTFAAGCAGTRYMTEPDVPIYGVLGQEKVTEASIKEALATKPQFSWPAKLAVAEIGRSELDGLTYRDRTILAEGLAPVSATDEKLWNERLRKDHPDIGAAVALPSLLVPASEDPMILRLRQAAAKVHADLLLVYMRESDWGERPNPASIAYLTILGLWISPGNDLEGCTVAKGILFDVRNGFVYGVVAGDAETRATVPAVYAEGTREKMRKRTRAESLTDLMDETSGLVGDLKARLLADLSRQAGN